MNHLVERPPAAPPGRKRRRLYRVALAGIATVLALFVLEIGTRIYVRATGGQLGRYTFRNEAGQDKIYRPHPYTAYNLAPGAIRRQSGIEMRINSLGYRGPEFPLEKPPGETRVVCVGGSTTFGTSVEEPDSWPRRLEGLLRSQLRDRPISVINAGVPGFTTAETLVNVALRVMDVSPDVLVILENVNDLAPRLWPHFASDYSHYRKPMTSPSQGFVDRALEKVSSFYALVRYKLTDYQWSHSVEYHTTVDFLDNRNRSEVDLDERTLRPFRDHLVMLCRLARGYEIRPVLCTMARRQDPGEASPSFVRAFDQQNEAIREIAASEKVALVDLDRELSGRDELFVDMVHTNVKGSAAVAKLVASGLSEKDVLASPATADATSGAAGAGVHH